MAESLVSLMAKLSWLAMRDWIRPMLHLSEFIEEIKTELNSADAYLKMADAYEDGSMLHDEFNAKVRDLVHLVEDAIDEYVLLCSKSILADHGYLYTVGANIVKQTTSIGNRRKIAVAIKEIKPRFQEARKRFLEFDQIHTTSSSRSTSSASASKDWHEPQHDGQFKSEIELVGIEGPKAELIEKLINGGQKLQVILVVGMGGMGKTTLVRNLYDDDKVKNHFKRHLWIDFATNSKSEEFLKDVIEKYCLESGQQAPERLGTMKCLDMKMEIRRFLENERYLIILDDVKALDRWKDCSHAFQKNDNGSRIIITTQDAEVAQSPDHIYKMKPMSDEDSQELFCLKAFGGGTFPGHLSTVIKSILDQCGGMPLGIEAIGSLLRCKEQKVAEWTTINKSLGKEMQGKHLKMIHTILSRCYIDTSQYLKPCFLYMTNFPDLIGHPILIRLWVAEGLVTKCEGKTADDVAEDYLSELVSRSLIQVAERRSDGRVRSYRIHGLMRILLTIKAKAQNFVTRNETIVSVSVSKVRRLSVQNNFINLNKPLCSLRSLLLFEGKTDLNKLTMPFLFDGKSKLLTVLDLQGAKVTDFPSVITEFLNLRYLSLRDTKVMEIPNTIVQLQKLETLDLKRTRVQNLPHQIKHLQQLQNILLYRYGDDKNGAFPSKHGFQAPEGIGALMSLQKLCFVEADEESGHIVEELGELTMLRRLGIVKLSTKHEGALWTSIQKMSQLRALSITTSNGEPMNLQGLNSPPECLERLYLTGALKSFPKWTESPSLQNLVKIFLKSSNLDEEPLNTLGNLKNLMHIELLQVYDGKLFRFRHDKFQKLKILGVRKLISLETVVIEENSMPNLEKFLIQECKRLKTLPQGIHRLFKLKKLDFVEMPEEIYASMTRLSGDEYRSIQHIPQVSFTTLEEQNWIIRRVPTLVKDPRASITSDDQLLVNEIKSFEKK